MPKTKLAGLKQQLSVAEEDVQLKVSGWPHSFYEAAGTWFGL
jgi:hypothetical protein